MSRRKAAENGAAPSGGAARFAAATTPAAPSGFEVTGEAAVEPAAEAARRAGRDSGAGSPTLLGQCQLLLENTYGAWTGVSLEDFVVGADRCRQLAGRAAANESAEYGPGGRFFFSLSGAELRMAIFYSDSLIERLETHDPRRGLTDENVLEFVVFLEELSHALHTSLTFREDRRRLRTASFLAELEIQAKVDVFLALVFFLQRLDGSGSVPPGARRWIEANLFDRWAEEYRDPRLARRYGLALTMGRQAVAYLDSLPGHARLAALRRMRRLSLRGKRRLLQQAA